MHASHICKMVKDDGIKVMLSGIGADELFGYGNDKYIKIKYYF